MKPPLTKASLPTHHLGIFIKYPKPRFVKTRIGQTLGYEKAAQIYRQFVTHTLEEAHKASHTKKVLLYEKTFSLEKYHRWLGEERLYIPQADTQCLGQKILQASLDLFSDETSSVTLIGSDCPTLTHKHLLAAQELIKKNDLVIGPSEDGGFYLITSSQPLSPSLLEEIQWSTSTVLEKLLKNAKAQKMSYYLIETLNDVDTEQDYLKLRTRGCPQV